MTTPGGCLRVLTQTLMWLARNGDVEGFRSYVGSNAFLAPSVVSTLAGGRAPCAATRELRPCASVRRAIPWFSQAPSTPSGPRRSTGEIL
jgi:hypothetical protein